MIYPVELQLKQRLKAAGFIVRDVAVALNLPPSSVSARLNGYAPLSLKERRLIEMMCASRETDNREAAQ